MDPRIKRIQAAARMPLPRLAADALADALAMAQEIARLQAQVTALSGHLEQSPPSDTVLAQVSGMRGRIASQQAQLYAARREIAALKGELLQRDEAHRARLSGDRTGAPCERCGTPTKRPGAKHCRNCYLILSVGGLKTQAVEEP